MPGRESAEGLPDHVRQDHERWLRQGIEISCWGVNPSTSRLEIGVRSSVLEAEKLLRDRYGADVHVYYANVVPAAGAVATGAG